MQDIHIVRTSSSVSFVLVLPRHCVPSKQETLNIVPFFHAQHLFGRGLKAPVPPHIKLINAR